MRVGVAAAAATLVAVLGCEAPRPSPEADAAPDVALPEPVTPAPPEAPSPAALTPCPTGWREVAPGSSAEVATCDPWPEAGRAACAAGSAHLPGAPGCEVLGDPCPAGEWAEELPAGRPAVFVRQGADPGGAGTRAAPVGTIAEAVDLAPAGAVIALSRGTYDEAVALPGGALLLGACVAETVVASSAWSEMDGTITATGDGAEVRSLTVSGHRPGVFLNGPGRSVTLVGVVVSDAESMGVGAVAGASVEARGLAVLGTRGRTRDGRFGRGLVAEGGGALDVEGAILEGNRDVGVWAHGEGTVVRLADAAVVDTAGRDSDGLGGRGLSADSGARVELEGVVIERSREAGVAAAGGATVALRDAVVRETLGDADGLAGRGVSLGTAAVLGATRLLVDQCRDAGVVAVGGGTSLSLVDAVVRDTETRRRDGLFGRGVGAEAGASVELGRVLVLRNRDAGLFAGGAGTVLALADVVVRETGPDGGGSFGRGLEVQGGARATVARALLLRNDEVGAFACDEGTELVVEDLSVQETEADGDGFFGRGLELTRGARGSGRRVAVELCRELGISAYGAETELALEDVSVVETLERACAEAGCADSAAGIGVGSYGGAHVELRRFAILDSAAAGVQLAVGGDPELGFFVDGGFVDLHEGLVAGCPVGANVQTEGYDLTRLMDEVFFRDNGRDLDMAVLPAPDAAVPLPE